MLKKEINTDIQKWLQGQNREGLGETAAAPGR